MSLESWVAFALLEAALCLTPGPAVLFVVSSAVAGGARAGVSATGGILAGNAVYFSLAAAGVVTAFRASLTLYTLVKWGGALYLVLLGARMLMQRAQTREPNRPMVAAYFVRAMGIQLANPKAIAFFVALLPQFLDPGDAMVPQVAILAATSIAIEALVLAFYVLLTRRALTSAMSRWTMATTRVAGVLLIAAGARLALTD